MNDEQKIKDVINAWIEASLAEDVDRVLSLMAEDVVFLQSGQQPMRGRAAFAAASRAGARKFRLVEGKPQVQEIRIVGDYAYCWNYLDITIQPLPEGQPVRRAGHILSVFRKEADGNWVLFRDANMLTVQ
jgi:uncharacterized protein (TIGR02246 family)